MKKIASIFTGMLLLSITAFAQSNLNLIIFSEDGDQFFAYINGIKQNERPESNVKVTNLTAPNISLRIEFNDKSLPQLKQNMALEMGYEHTAKIVRDMKKQLKLRYFGQTPIGETPNAGMATVEYHTADNSAPVDQPQTTGNTITSTTTTTQTYNNGGGAVNINVAGPGITMNMSGVDPNAGNINSTTSTTVTKTSTSTSGSSSSGSQVRHKKGQHHQQASGTTTGCTTAMTSANFATMKKSVESKPFSDTKMSTAKVATKNACLSVDQVKQIGKLFMMDDEKRAYAEFAYDYCVDKANYYQVSDIFSFSGTTEDFNKFLESK
ncbi:MAG: DUF4476 domain-containing protein [Bacteroidota bacterium]